MSVEFELVLPCYNESKNLRNLVRQIASAADQFKVKPEEFQVVLVDNGSLDDSLQVLEELKRRDEGIWFRILKIPVNQGYGYGIFEGLKSTTAPILGWAHADLQCDPQYALKLYQMIKATRSELSFGKGVRFGRNWKDRCVSRVFEILAFLICGLRMGEINAQPKIFHRKLMEDLKAPPKDFSFDLYVLFKAQKARAKLLLTEVPFPPRIHGVSNWAAHFLMRYKTIFKMIQSMWRLARKEGRAG